jgi:hypothetical protein
MRPVLIAITLFAVLWVGYLELEDFGRGMLVVVIAGAAALLLPSVSDPGNDGADSSDDGDGGSDD